MPSMWTHLLFLHGHVADAELARRLAGCTPDSGGRRTGWCLLYAWLGRLGRGAILALSR